MPRSTLYIGQILEWADAHFGRTCEWPNTQSGLVPGTLDEKWINIDSALRQGYRGLPLDSGLSLARLLAEQRDVVSPRAGGRPGSRPKRLRSKTRLSVEQILQWADTHYQQTGNWPNIGSGKVQDAPDENWRAIDLALRRGYRRLPAGSGASLVRLLAKHRGVRNRMQLPDLSEEQILAWADAYHAQTGQWPRDKSGPIGDVPGDRWSTIDAALVNGNRSLPGGSSLARLLANWRGVRNMADLPKFTIDEILNWADAHHQRTGTWPGEASGPIDGVPEETWRAVDASLRNGDRGLPGGSSLAKLLADRRGVRNHYDLARLTKKQILAGPMRTLSALERGPPVLAAPSQIVTARRGARSIWL